MKIHRCGYCGTPTDKDGESLSLDECNELTEEQLNDAELVHGYCCLEEMSKQNESNYVTVTRDMAIDACDLRLEGQIIKW